MKSLQETGVQKSSLKSSFKVFAWISSENSEIKVVDIESRFFIFILLTFSILFIRLKITLDVDSEFHVDSETTNRFKIVFPLGYFYN